MKIAVSIIMTLLTVEIVKIYANNNLSKSDYLHIRSFNRREHIKEMLIIFIMCGTTGSCEKAIEERL